LCREGRHCGSHYKENINIQKRRLSREDLDRQRRKAEQRKSGGVAGVFYRALPQLTFDCGDDGPGCAEDVHRVQALVFVDNGPQNAQQLAESLVDRLMEAVLMLWKSKKSV